MTKHFCGCLSLKTGAILMCFLNFLEGSVEIIASMIELSNLESHKRIPSEKDLSAVGNITALKNPFVTKESGIEGNATLFTVCLILGLMSLFNGVLLLIGIIQAKERYILWYVLLGGVDLFIVTIYSGINMFHNSALVIVFVLSIFMCYGQISMYNFYEEMAEYNTVKSGVIEISYNGELKTNINSEDVANEAV